MTLHQYFVGLFDPVQMAELLLRVVVAGICGILIGLERTKRLKEAGIRTHFLVACSSAAIMIVSKYGFADLALALFPGESGADGARLAAQVVSGIGFLGAGMIFRGDSKISGLTTAAGLWATAGIGLTVGSGMYILGVFCTLLILLVQWLTHRLSFRKDSMVTRKLSVTVKEADGFRNALTAFLQEGGIQVKGNQIQKNTDGTFTYGFRLQSVQKEPLDDLLEFLEQQEHIVSYQINTLE